jgi:hypothetical protein
MRYGNLNDRIYKVYGVHLPTAALWFRNVISYSEKNTMVKNILTLGVEEDITFKRDLSTTGFYTVYYRIYQRCAEIQSDSKLLSGFPWPIIFKSEAKKK